MAVPFNAQVHNVFPPAEDMHVQRDLEGKNILLFFHKLKVFAHETGHF